MSEPIDSLDGTGGDRSPSGGVPAGGARPSEAQRRYLSRGVGQPGGKLPLLGEDGRGIDRKTIESCIERGWAEPWFANPTKPGWLVCKLTEAGYAAIVESQEKRE